MAKPRTELPLDAFAQVLGNEEVAHNATDIAVNKIAGDVLTNWKTAKPKGKSRQSLSWNEEGRVRLIIRMIVANAICANADGIEWIFYARGYSAYSSNVYCAPFVRPKLLVGTIERLCALGYIEDEPALPNQRTRKKRRSRFRATDRMISPFVSDPNVKVTRSNDAPVAFLKSAEKQLLQYDPTKEPASWHIACTKLVNEFMKTLNITLKMPASVAYPKVNLSKCRYHRVFNDGRWDRGGRWWGPFFQNMKSEYRKNLLINGEETVEVDFCSMFPSLMYRNIIGESCMDAYDIPGIRIAAEREGCSYDAVRPFAKVMFNMIANTETIRGLWKSEEFDEWPLKTLKVSDAIRMVRDHHSELFHPANRESTLKIMNIEARICTQVLVEAAIERIPVLGIHDSFVTLAKHKDWLIKVMSEAFEGEVGFKPNVKIK